MENFLKYKTDSLQIEVCNRIFSSKMIMSTVHVKWNISCHINKQGCNRLQWFQSSKCKFLSPEGPQEGEQYLQSSSCQPTPFSTINKNLRMWIIKKQDAGPRWLRSTWKKLFQCTQTLASSPNISSVQFSRSVMSDSLQPHESQHARPPCPSRTPRVHSDSRPSNQWCHPAISSSVVPFSFCP